MAGTLTLYVGSVKPLRVDVVDSAGNAEDITTATRATLLISNDAGGAVLSRDTAAGNLTKNGSGYDVTVTQVEADALPTGTYLAQLNLEFPSGWIPTQEFHAVIRPAIAPQLP